MAKSQSDKIRKQIKALREAAGIAARKMQIDTDTQKLYEFENGTRDVKLETLSTWCEYLGVQLHIVKQTK